MVGRTILEVTIEADRAANAQKLLLLRERKEAFTIRKHYVAGDGSLVKVQNHVNMMTDGVGGERIIATIVPLVTPNPGSELTGMLLAARNLVAEKTLRSKNFDCIFRSDPRWDVLLAAYILEAEGRSSTSFEVCEKAEVEEQVGILALWDLIAADYLAPEGRAGALRDMGIGLSAKGMAELSGHLRQLRETGAFV